MKAEKTRQDGGWHVFGRYVPRLMKLWSVWWWRDFGCVPRPRCRSFLLERNHHDRVELDTRRDPTWSSWGLIGAQFRSGMVAAIEQNKKIKIQFKKKSGKSRINRFFCLLRRRDWRVRRPVVKRNEQSRPIRVEQQNRRGEERTRHHVTVPSWKGQSVDR